MKSFWQKLLHYSGIVIGIAALYIVYITINGSTLREAIAAVNVVWLVPIILVNVLVIFSKAYRWQALVKPLHHVSLLRITKILTIGFMANNILPARLGDAMRIHMMNRKTDLGRAATTGGLIADKIIEGLSFLFLTVLLFIFSNVPQWMRYGLGVTLLIIIGMYIAAHIYSRSNVRHPALARFQEGLAPLHNHRVFWIGVGTSLVSWLMQMAMIHMTQLAFGVHLPLWGTMLVLVAVNLAVITPGPPAHIGTFELACVLSYTFLGIDKNVGLLVGATYHLVQVLPVTLVGALILLVERLVPVRAVAADPDAPYYP